MVVIHTGGMSDTAMYATFGVLGFLIIVYALIKIQERSKAKILPLAQESQGVQPVPPAAPSYPMTTQQQQQQNTYKPVNNTHNKQTVGYAPMISAAVSPYTPTTPYAAPAAAPYSPVTGYSAYPHMSQPGQPVYNAHQAPVGGYIPSTGYPPRPN
ncbi:hypothetical protein BGZ96_000393 [Linnemannia gamsii]|uniref:Uncharacterized protein n=1 Tax=Linnemannia gamsii TaxID=64522 RepID=A0ABQ7KAT3_9FUNG|nr:hypothetical protein BGZ96_000393 [Linnemannia gamsii]